MLVYKGYLTRAVCGFSPICFDAAGPLFQGNSIRTTSVFLPPHLAPEHLDLRLVLQGCTDYGGGQAGFDGMDDGLLGEPVSGCS